MTGELAAISEWFPSWSGDGLAAYREALLAALLAGSRANESRGGLPAGRATPEELAALVAGMSVFPPIGKELDQVVMNIGGMIARYSVDVTHPLCAAHLQCRPLTSALAAEVLISGLNQSMDSWDQAPIATEIERHIVAALAAEIGFDPLVAGGMFTSGGTQSNLMGLMLGRASASRGRGWDISALGLPPDACKFRILCSVNAHFSIARSAAILGLGHRSIIPIQVDALGQMDLADLDATLGRLDRAGEIPMVLVATAGTTELGAIDPIGALAERARRCGSWLHVDAAYGGALLFSKDHRDRLSGIDKADSVSIDFHKLLWQPLSCGAFLTRGTQELDTVGSSVPYLNPEDDEGAGMHSLVGVSPLETSRRFEALKLLISFHVVGRRGIGLMLDRLLDLAVAAAHMIDAERELELRCRPSLTTVVFRYRRLVNGEPDADDASTSAFNGALRRSLLQSGRLILGRASVADSTYLRLTLLNPSTTHQDLRAIVALVLKEAAALYSESSLPATPLGGGTYGSGSR